jgi:hypothetical protein
VEENGHYRGEKAREFIEKFGPNWGDVKSGIQYGIALTNPSKEYRSGERVSLAVFFRNASDQSLELDMRPDYFGNPAKVVNSNGVPLELENVPLVGRIPHYVEQLKPGESVGPFYLSFGLGENPYPGKQHWHPYLKEPPLGRLRVTHVVALQTTAISTSGKSNKAEVTSGTIEFEIVKPANGEDLRNKRDASRGGGLGEPDFQVAK